MLLLADRDFDVATIIESAAATGAQPLIRGGGRRKMPVAARLADGAWLTRIGTDTVCVIDADIVVTGTGDRPAVRRVEPYQPITTLVDEKFYPAEDLAVLYHQRWEIEASCAELKSTMLGGRVLRARQPELVTQEIYPLLVAYQAPQTAIADATLATGTIQSRPRQLHRRPRRHP